MNTTQPTLTLIAAARDDLDYEFAKRAHQAVSMNPDGRARLCQDEYLAEMAHIEAEFAPYAIIPADVERLKAMLEEYRQGYLKHWRSILDARSRTASSLVTGPANFPTARNAKRLATELRRYETFVHWRERFYTKLHATFNPASPRFISSDRDDAVAALQTKLAEAEKLQAAMVTANKIVRSRTDDATKIARLMQECGLSEANARQALQPDFAGHVGFPDYALKNNSAEIRRLRQRIKDVTAQQSRPARLVEFEGGHIEDNPDNNRVQIFFESKPDAAMRTKLKASGFRWSPSAGAWQRKRTDAGIHATETLLGVTF